MKCNLLHCTPCVCIFTELPTRRGETPPSLIPAITASVIVLLKEKDSYWSAG